MSSSLTAPPAVSSFSESSSEDESSPSSSPLFSFSSNLNNFFLIISSSPSSIFLFFFPSFFAAFRSFLSISSSGTLSTSGTNLSFSILLYLSVYLLMSTFSTSSSILKEDSVKRARNSASNQSITHLQLIYSNNRSSMIIRWTLPSFSLSSPFTLHFSTRGEWWTLIRGLFSSHLTLQISLLLQISRTLVIGPSTRLSSRKTHCPLDILLLSLQMAQWVILLSIASTLLLTLCAKKKEKVQPSPNAVAADKAATKSMFSAAITKQSTGVSSPAAPGAFKEAAPSRGASGAKPEEKKETPPPEKKEEPPKEKSKKEV
ncbi:hypothetical protein PMAYCL1PPCAC_23455, partial [Pristionchus mayeri]